MKRNITQYIENNSNDHEKYLHYNKKYKSEHQKDVKIYNHNYFVENAPVIYAKRKENSKEKRRRPKTVLANKLF